MIEKLQKYDTEESISNSNSKYFTFISKNKNFSMPLKIIDTKNKDLDIETFGFRKHTTDMQIFDSPQEKSHKILMDEKIIQDIDYVHNKDEIQANEYILRRALKILDSEKPQGKCFEHSLAHIKYMDLQMRNAEKICRLNSEIKTNK